MRSGNLQALHTASLDNSPVFFFQGEFRDSTIYLWTGSGDITWNSEIWLGNGLLHGFSGGEEVNDVSSTSIEVLLSGLSESLLAVVLSPKQGAPGYIYMGFLDDTGALIGDPIQLFKGRLDVPIISETESTSEVKLVYETHLLDFDRKREFRYTPESQKLFYPDDTGFRYVVSADKWDGFWGNKKNKRNRRKKRREQRRGQR